MKYREWRGHRKERKENIGWRWPRRKDWKDRQSACGSAEKSINQNTVQLFFHVLNTWISHALSKMIIIFDQVFLYYNNGTNSPISHVYVPCPVMNRLPIKGLRSQCSRNWLSIHHDPDQGKSGCWILMTDSFFWLYLYTYRTLLFCGIAHAYLTLLFTLIALFCAYGYRKPGKAEIRKNRSWISTSVFNQYRWLYIACILFSFLDYPVVLF